MTEIDCSRGAAVYREHGILHVGNAIVSVFLQITGTLKCQLYGSIPLPAVHTVKYP